MVAKRIILLGSEQSRTASKQTRLRDKRPGAYLLDLYPRAGSQLRGQHRAHPLELRRVKYLASENEKDVGCSADITKGASTMAAGKGRHRT
jgi:hypothetical protein